MFCIKCGTKLEEDARFCYKCGFPVPDQLKYPIADVPMNDEKDKHDVMSQTPFIVQEDFTKDEDAEIRQFVGDNADYYLKKWKASSTPEKSASWNWPAFLIAPYWLAYRKMYKLMTIVLVINVLIAALINLLGLRDPIWYLIDIIPLGIGISLGIFGNALYYRHMQKKRHQWENDPSLNTRKSLAQIGGTSWIGIIIILGSSLLLGVIIGIIAFVIGFSQAMTNVQAASHVDQNTENQMPSFTKGDYTGSMIFGTNASKSGLTNESDTFTGNSPIFFQATFDKPVGIDTIKVYIIKQGDPTDKLLKIDVVNPNWNSFYFRFYNPDTDKHLDEGYYKVMLVDINRQLLCEGGFDVKPNY